MKRHLVAFTVAAMFAAASSAAFAHHSFAMFDQEHPMELKGTVQEFKFTSPHTFVLRGQGGRWQHDGLES